MTHTNLVQLEEILKTKGLRSGLEFLNSRVPHRCTAIYRLSQGDLEMVELVDKLNDPATAALRAVPYSQSFCQAVAGGGPLMTSNSLLEPRLDGTTYQGVITSYVGLPLSRGAGDLVGTLCHYDFAEQSISDDEYDFLQHAALVLLAHV